MSRKHSRYTRIVQVYYIVLYGNRVIRITYCTRVVTIFTPCCVEITLSEYRVLRRRHDPRQAIDLNISRCLRDMNISIYYSKSENDSTPSLISKHVSSRVEASRRLTERCGDDRRSFIKEPCHDDPYEIIEILHLLNMDAQSRNPLHQIL